ncbi:hypothetical protein OG205_09375 [Lentzea sp. NBC_00516]|uniref:carbamoyltransferase family protein n=1 Tax=Lentzea sp. NBC_00516 TaxID=2903582 RepID=UPI002E81DBE4|nr:carbamoyltransferase C-terminal domain-containing protein [Lentzea sp. NBC_00516]WUD27184.1 hypothetical protein OG205_09375 [Lentzea sp. NBC_00516]
MLIVGVNTGEHDGAAAAVLDGQVVAFAEQERFSRRKHAVGELPRNSFDYVLAAIGATVDDVDCFVVPWVDNSEYRRLMPGLDPEVTFSARLDVPLANCPRLDAVLAGRYRRRPRVACVSHHLAHASSAFYPSGLDEAAVLVVDGWGDRVSVSIAHGVERQLNLLRQAPLVDSLGYFYAAASDHLGMGVFGEGKAMGLAAYGEDDLGFDEMFSFDEDIVRLVSRPSGDVWDPTDVSPERVYGHWREIFSRFRLGPSWDRGDGLPPGVNFAASVQGTLERSVLRLADIALRVSESRNLCVGGGVALNCSANGKLSRFSGLANLFVQPIAHDAGNAIGSALHIAALLGEPRCGKMRTTALGPEFSDAVLAATLREYGFVPSALDDPAEVVASLLAAGRMVGYFQGRMEGGPRALGQRSILGSAGSVSERDKMNLVKRRAFWRPIAPMLREETAEIVLENLRCAPFMVVADKVTAFAAEFVPAVVHVDGTARPQIVSATTQPMLWAILDRLEKLGGGVAVMNTSFNDELEPIVCTPAEAMRTFMGTSMDALAIGPFVVEKSRS